MKDNYNDIEDFICDESFRSYVFQADEKVIAEWNLWLQNNSGKKQMADEAIAILQAMRVKENPVNEQQLSNAEVRLRNAIQVNNIPAKVISIQKRRWLWYAAAAIIIVSVTIGLGLSFYSPVKTQLASKYGEVKKDHLPDGTEVILNAHSIITLGKHWKEGNDREVWVKGEAFFHVKKTAHHDKFIVHTDAFDIEVTGTSFNVINLNGNSSVILKEGSVKIHRPGEAEINMKPGDYVEFSNQQIQKKIVTKQDYIAWTENKLVFDNTPLTELVNIIKQHYGVDVKLEGENIEKQTINGIMPNNNLDVLLQALDATEEFKIIHKNDSITIINEVQ
jgi:transmembrane sensor